MQGMRLHLQVTFFQAILGKILANLDKIWANLGKIWVNLIKFGQNLISFEHKSKSCISKSIRSPTTMDFTHKIPVLIFSNLYYG